MAAERVSQRVGLRRLLADPGTRLTATFQLLPRVEIAECAAAVGYDAVMLDLEHGPYGAADLMPLVAAGQGAGLQVLVRVPDVRLVGAVLDLGADGVVVPHVSSAAEAAAVVAAARFPPVGERSINPYVRAAGYQGGEDWTARANDEVAVLVMIEGADGVAALDDICVISGLDAVFVGPIDLSAALGFPGQPEHPEVVAEVRRVLEHAAAAGVATGLYCPTPQAAGRWQRAGARLVVLSADLAMVYDGLGRYLRGIDRGNDEEDSA